MQSCYFARSFSFLLLIISFVSFAQAGDLPRYTQGGGVVHGGNPAFAKAGADTINLMAASDDPTNNTDPRDGGLEPYYDGDFADSSGSPNWNGWTHYDIANGYKNHWQVSNYNQADPANHAAWCGDINIAACSTNDVPGGYGNGWNDVIEFRQTIPDPGSSSRVSVTATLLHHSENGYDYTRLSYRFEGQDYADMQIWDGAGTVAVSDSVTYLPSDYLDGTDIAVQFRFSSDGGHSDEDCLFPSSGACQVDDINVHLENGVFTADYFEDFEHGGDPADLGIWKTINPVGMGDFAKIWVGLGDEDPCATNITAQVAFIDDGIVVPGTGGSECINWCYGPYGYIVNTTGGLLSTGDHLHNGIESPVMAWPSPKDAGAAVYDGALLEFTVYVHEDLTADSPGIFYTWGVRSADTDGSAGNGVQAISVQSWQDRNYIYFGGPEYRRDRDDVTDLMNAGRDEIQVQLTVYELGWVWYWTGNDGYPAPYFDNVTVKVFPYHGPAITAREIDLAQDNFPERGSIDYGDLGSHHVRFDMADYLNVFDPPSKFPGDTIGVNIVSLRAGADFDGDPELHYTLDRNPVFGPYRGALPKTGSVSGLQPEAVAPGSPWWFFVLPDTGFMYPGDVLHYYISATDAIGGFGGTDPQTSLMPADTTGFSTGFGDPMGYNPSFTIRALPSIREDGAGGYEQPGILFINDFANRGGENEWYTALNNIGLKVGEDYDVYYVNGPSSGVGNGIGGRATQLLLAGYEDILYTSGNLGVNTIANGDFSHDPGDDVGTLRGWLDQGGKDLFLTGDGLVSDLAQSGAATQAFLENYLGAISVASDIRSLIGAQTTPLVQVIPGNQVFNGPLHTWIAYGGCEGINTFDGVHVYGSGQRVAEFLDPGGNSGQYLYSAATLNLINPGPTQSRVISMPVDLMYVYTDPASASNPLPGRALLLKDVLQYFGVVGDPGDVSNTPDLIAFTTTNYPNPFNPKTTIRYSLPRAGHLKLSIYNVRGQLIKTLIDGPRPVGADQTIVWDGSDNLGSSVASGLYFYEARAMGEVKVGKMTLLR